MPKLQTTSDGPAQNSPDGSSERHWQVSAGAIANPHGDKCQDAHMIGGVRTLEDLKHFFDAAAEVLWKEMTKTDSEVAYEYLNNGVVQVQTH